MPPGWTRREAVTIQSPDNKPRLHPDGCDKYIFEHEAGLQYNGAPLEWYYPFPVKEIQESTPHFMPEQTRYLFCETFQATLSGYQKEDDPRRFYGPEVTLCNNIGKKIGKLSLVNEDFRDRFPEKMNGTEKGLPVNVVAICKLKRYYRPWIPEERECGSQVITEELYLVLWVEWKDGIAYRFASGEVIAAEWEKLDLQKVSLVLG
jgi:hypothetical protein